MLTRKRTPAAGRSARCRYQTFATRMAQCRVHIRTIRVTRYVTPLREGGSLPAIVEADDDGMYVLKFRGAGQGPKALISELVCGEIGRALGLPVPEIVFASSITISRAPSRITRFPRSFAAAPVSTLRSTTSRDRSPTIRW